MDENPIDEVIESIGALAETLWIHYTAFRAAGFSRSQAMTLTVTVLTEVERDMLKGDSDAEG